MRAIRLCLFALTTLLAVAHAAAADKPYRGTVRYTDQQHLPVRKVEPTKTKSSPVNKTKKPVATAAVDSKKKKTPVKPIVAAAKKTSKPVDDKYRSEFEEYMRQQIQQWQIAVVNGQQVSPSQPGQPPSSVWIQVPANGYYPPPSSYPYPSYPSQQYPSPSYPPPSYPSPSYPPPSYPSPSYPPPSYPQPSPYPQQPLYPPQPIPSPTTEESEEFTSPPFRPESVTPQSEEMNATAQPGYLSTPAPEYPSTPTPVDPGTPPPEVAEPDIPEYTQAPTDKPEGSTELPEVIPAYPDTAVPEQQQPGVPLYPGLPVATPTTIQPGSSSEVSTDQPSVPEKPITETSGEESEVTTNTPSTDSPDAEIPSSTSPPSTDALKAQCKEPRGQFAIESSCNKFVNCWDDTAVEQTCPAGLAFNEEKRYCDYPANVDCGSKPITATENGNNTKCPDAYGTYRSQENCGAFYVCVAGSPVQFICPGGTNYNEDLKICDYPYRVDCKGLPSNPEPVESGTEVEPATTFIPEVSSSTAPTVPLSSAESSPATEVVSTSTSTVAPIAPAADPIANYNYNLRRIPPSLVNTGVRCSHKSIYRLTPDCSSVTLCRNGFTHILNCGYATSYDILSQKCMESRRANCGRSY